MRAARLEALIARKIAVRPSTLDDLEPVRRIYNEGIEDRVATLDSGLKSSEEMAQWWSEHGGRFNVLVATDAERVIGWERGRLEGRYVDVIAMERLHA
jgi:hypothetical protein